MPRRKRYRLCARSKQYLIGFSDRLRNFRWEFPPPESPESSNLRKHKAAKLRTFDNLSFLIEGHVFGHGGRMPDHLIMAARPNRTPVV